MLAKQKIHNNWKLKRTDTIHWQHAVVPGTVYTDLLRNGEMEDPFYRDNENEALERMEYDYEYQCVFLPDPKVLEKQRQVLRFEGLDTITEVFLNGQRLGDTENMHRVWEFSVTGLLKENENILRVVLHSPNQYVRKAFLECRTLGSEDALDGFVHIRKAHCMFGWDWGAHLPDAGIFREVVLIGLSENRIEDVYVRQEHGDGRVMLNLDICCERKPENLEILVRNPNGEEIIRTTENEGICISNPKLWWPNGFGEQPLYTVEVRILTEDRVLDTWQRRIGLRTMTMKREKDSWGESFAHEVNGVAIFAMGADYIPEDHLIGRTTKERTRQLLADAKMANFNVIRVWGGGYYPEDWFFDCCDEMGLIVWQDFMFACAVYELTPEFKANIRQEFIDNVKRIRHHASLGLWCGNNEMEQFVSEKHHWVTKHSEVRDYIIMYEHLIPEILKEYDPQTFYWPASPSSGGSFDEPNDPNRGDVHYWQVWHGNKPFSEYRKYFFRYASEFGFQSFPSMKTIEAFTKEKEDYNPFSYIMEKHQRNYGANGKIMNYLQQTFLYPNDFATFLYASQLLQAEAIRYGVEHFRRNRGRCMGAVYWQLNDCWPVISWSSIDYTGRLKALHYYAKRFFAPLMLSCQEEGMMTQEADMNREHFRFEKSITLNVANETMKEQSGVVSWFLRNADGSVCESEKLHVVVPPLTSKWLPKVLFPDADIFSQYVSYTLEIDGQQISEGTVLFSYPKYFRYQDPRLECSVNGDEIIVRTSAYAKSVEVQNQQENLVLSDNYFDLNSGEKCIKILRGTADQIRLRSVYDIK